MKKNELGKRTGIRRGFSEWKRERKSVVNERASILGQVDDRQSQKKD
jgi:hypothetical protein